MDFGLAREEAQSDLTQSGGIVGTPAFMSPEQCQGKLLDKRTDIYSLGGTLHYLMTGRLPFEGSVELVIAKIATGERPPTVHSLNAFVPPEVSRLVSRAMAPLPRERYPNVQEFVAEIGRVAKTPDLPSTESWDKGGSQALVDTNPACELAPLELITDDEPASRRQPWQIWTAIGVAAVLLLCAIGFGIRALVGPKAVEDDAKAPGSTALAATAAPQVAPLAGSSGARRPDKSRMVAIPAGMTTVGDTPERLRLHLQQIPLLAQNAPLLEQAVQQLSLFPSRQVSVPAFWIDKYEVTNAEYAAFVAEKGWEAPSDWVDKRPPVGTERFPVTRIRHKDAEAYASWAGKKLPTHSQWSRAFRSDQNVLFPWGDVFDATKANVAENPAFNGLTAVDATPEDRSRFGVFNLVGNASEYLRDRESVLGKSAVLVKGANGQSEGLINGMAGAQTYLVEVEIADPFVGFRCVLEEP
jgi:serine/threonine-protein kinase